MLEIIETFIGIILVSILVTSPFWICWLVDKYL